jgi:hypothetical protein
VKRNNTLLLVTGLAACAITLGWVVLNLQEDGADAPETVSGLAPPEVEDAPAATLEPPTQTGRVAVAPTQAAAPTTVEPEPEPEPVPGQTAIYLVRWPDGIPIKHVAVDLLIPPRLALRGQESSGSGRLLLGEELRMHEGFLYVEAPGFATGKAELGPLTSAARRVTVSMKPLTGWIGRAIDDQGEPVSAVQIAGWWQETPKPIPVRYTDAIRQMRFSQRWASDWSRAQRAQRAQRGSTSQYLGAHGAISATRRTTEDGMFYIEPLLGEVAGVLAVFSPTHVYSTALVQVSIPDSPVELPDLVLRPPLELRGIVIDSEERAVEGAEVFTEFRSDASPELARTLTDEHGRFSLLAPATEVLVSAEKGGLIMAPADVKKSASADGLWTQLGEFTQDADEASGLMRAAYGAWTLPHPRSREWVSALAGDHSLRLVMNTLSGGRIVVRDAHTTNSIPGAGILVTYAAATPPETALQTDPLGAATIALTDLAWNPVQIEVTKPGYLPAKQLFPVDRQELEVLLWSEAHADTAAPQIKLQGMVVSPDGTPSAAMLAVYIDQKYPRLIYEGSVPSDGRIDAVLPPLENCLLQVFALKGEGAAQQAGRFGPIASNSLAGGMDITLKLAPSRPVNILARSLETHRNHSIELRLIPLKNADPMHTQWLRVPAGDFQFADQVWAPFAWRVSGALHGDLPDTTPTQDYASGERRQERYLSTSTRWTRWMRLGPFREELVSGPASTLFIEPAVLGTIHGTVAGVDPGNAHSLRVSARGNGADWMAEVDRSGGFFFADMPRGEYEITLYETPTFDQVWGHSDSFLGRKTVSVRGAASGVSFALD